MKSTDNKINKKTQIRVTDVPYIYLDRSLFCGNIEKVAKNILEIRDQLKIKWDERHKAYPKGNFTSFEQYQYIQLDFSYDDGGFEINIVVYRDETDEEYQNRLDNIEKRREYTKKAAEKRKIVQEKKEKELFQKLKEKYGTD